MVTHKHTSMASRVFLSNFFAEQRTQNHPPYLLGSPRVLFPTTFLEIAVFNYSTRVLFKMTYSQKESGADKTTLIKNFLQK